MARMSYSEYIAFLARSGTKNTSAGEGVERESALHAEISAECSRRGWLAFHGSMVKATARTEGEPDFVILAERGRTLLIECKTKTGKCTPAQNAVAAWAQKLDHRVYVVRSLLEFHEAINNELSRDL